MKRTFLARHNILLSPDSVLWGATILIIVCAVVFVRLFAPNLFWKAAAPIFSAGDSVAQKTQLFFTGFANTAKLSVRIDTLEEQNTVFAIENQTLLAKDADLLALFASSSTINTTLPGITAGVITRPPMSPYDTFVVAAGSAQGVTIGMEAFAQGNVPIGLVTFTTSSFSKITLFSSPGEKTIAWVGNHHIPLLLQGVGGGAFLATVPRATTVKVGDIIYVPGPGAVPVGIVESINGAISDPTATLRITPEINYFSVTWLLLRSGPPPALITATTTQFDIPLPP